MTEQEKAERFAGEAPQLSQEERDAINALFPAYVFRRAGTDELWTSCCRQHLTAGVSDLGLRATEEDLREVWSAAHQREAANRWQEEPGPSVPCPVCGTRAIVKDLRYCGQCGNLSRYRRAVVLRWHRGALWATAYDCAKHYARDKGYPLTGGPQFRLVGVYRFRPGLAEATTRYFWGYPFLSISRQDGPLKKGRWNIPGPFCANAQYGVGYDVIGLQEVQKSPFCYCMAAEAEKKIPKFLHFLTACCIYPQQIEMLMKSGMIDVVEDLAERGVKHAAVIGWDTPQTPFKLTRQEIKEFFAGGHDIRVLELYKRLRGRASIKECTTWISGDLYVNSTIQAAKKWGLPPEKLMRYLYGNVGCARYGGISSMGSALRYWEDYLTAAEAMGYLLYRQNILLPRNLSEAHDAATAAHREKMNRERAERQRERARQSAAAYGKRQKELETKYSFSLGGYLIRVPAGREEILAEGRSLQHCVGGYADRHIDGSTTILFMRRESQPDKPWLTIEMDGNQMRQIHGYKNEGVLSAQGRFAPDPRETFREFLDIWLDWLKKGSRRDKKGNPKLPKKKGAAA